MVKKCTHLRTIGVLVITSFVSTASFSQNCNCDTTVPRTTYRFNAAAIAPGGTICLAPGVRTQNLVIENIRGTAANKITIINCGGRVIFRLRRSTTFGLKTERSSYFRITGTGSSDFYGILIDSSSNAMQLGGLSSDFEVDHVEITNPNFSGIMAKTDSSGPRTGFVMRNVSFHHNYVHGARTGEGFYIGNTSWAVNGYQHDIDSLLVYDNITDSTGREGIQIGATYNGKAYVYNNRVTNAGIANIHEQRSGVQLGNGFAGRFYNNYIENTLAHGVIVLGPGNVYLFNNVIINPGQNGIYRGSATAEAGKHVYFINNTIVMGTSTAPVIQYRPQVASTAYIYNNASVRSASVTTPVFLRESGTLDTAGNVVRTNIADFRFENPPARNYDILAGSVAINAGINVAAYGITWDYEYRPRPVSSYDAGAYEYQVTPSGTVLYRVNAGGQEVPDSIINWVKDKQTDPSDWLDPTSSNYTTGSDQPWSGTNTTDAPSQLFSTNRYAGVSGHQVNYNFPVTNGTYEVRLYFAENTYQAAGQRVFDVALEGVTRLDNFDIYGVAGYRTAYKATFTVTVSDGILDLDFIRVTGNPQINGIAIHAAATARSGMVSISTIPPAPVSNQLQAYPVPLQNQLFIQKKTTGITSTDREEVEVQLFNETGTTVYQAKHRFTGGRLNPIRLSPLALRTGVYFLKLSGLVTQEVIRLVK